MPRLRFSIALLSASVIAWQLALIQILSLAHWHHFAYMVLSVAMLGFGASGTVLALFRGFFLSRSGSAIPALMLLTSVAMGSSVFLVESVVGGFDTWLLFIDRGQILNLALVYLIYTSPFFFAALAIGLILTRHAADIGRIYFFNMAGSGAGGLAGVLALWVFFPEQLTSVIALLPLIAALPSVPVRGRKRFLAPVLLVLAVCAAGIIRPPGVSISQYKGLSGAMNLPDARIIAIAPGPYGVTAAVETGASRYAPGVSLAYTGTIPVVPMLYVNGNWSGPLVDPATARQEHGANLFHATTKHLPYLVNPADHVLVISSGTGRHAAHALSAGAGNVTAVEANRTLISVAGDLGRDHFGAGIYDDPAIRLITDSNRAWLNRSGGGYSHIILPTLDAFGGTSGLYALQEQYDLTLEALSRMWNLLADDGVIAATSWLDQPPRNTLRILALLAETARKHGIGEPARHITAIRSWATITYVVSRQPLDDAQIAAVRRFCDVWQFDPALLPTAMIQAPDASTGPAGVNATSDDYRQRYHLTDPAFFDHLDALLDDRRTGFFRDYLFNVRPPTDNRPFFSQFLKAGTILNLGEQFGRGSIPYIELGYLVLLLTGVQTVVAAVVFIILPLFRLGWKGRNKGWTLFYFGGIGTGFMLVEVNLIQQFIHYFGEPVFATAAVLGLLLISSGTGSWFSGRVPVRGRPLPLVLFVIAAVILLMLWLLPVVIQATSGMPLAVRLLLGSVLVVPLGFIMGIPFPSGIRRLSGSDARQVPWAWGINGCLSVVSTVFAVWLALEAGYSSVLLTGAIAYAVAGLATLIASS